MRRREAPPAPPGQEIEAAPGQEIEAARSRAVALVALEQGRDSIGE